MRDQDASLGCFHKIFSGLMGLGLYLFCSVFFCCGSSWLIGQMNIDSPNTGDGFIAVAVSFLVVGPLMVLAYVLYMREQASTYVPNKSENPLHKVSYLLLGLCLYGSCSFFSSQLGVVLLKMSNLAAMLGVERAGPDGLNALLQLLPYAISFLVIGPLIVFAYILYLRDIKAIEVPPPAPPLIKQDKKRKKAY